jgi:hypothetical protein
MTRQRGPGAVGGVAFVAVTALLSVLAMQAATKPDPLFINGYVFGPCDVTPSSTVVVLVDGEQVGSGAIGARDWSTECRGAISVNDLEPANEYTVDAGLLSATVTAERTGGVVAIHLEEE